MYYPAYDSHRSLRYSNSRPNANSDSVLTREISQTDMVPSLMFHLRKVIHNMFMLFSQTIINK